MRFARFTSEFRVTGEMVVDMYSDALYVCPGLSTNFSWCAAGHVKQDKGRRKHTDFALAQELPQALVCTPVGHRRMAALGADGQAQPWCLAAQAFLHCVGRTTDVGEGLISAGPSMRGIGRMCLAMDSVGMQLYL